MLKKKQVVAIVSIALVCFFIGTSMASDGGSPWIQVWTAISELQIQVDDLNASVIEQTSRIDNLNTSYLDLLERVELLENQTLPQGFINAPAYDSGWITIAPHEEVYLVHDLNTTELFVYIFGKDRWGVMHQYALNDYSVSVGLNWHCDSKRIWLYRGGDASAWEQVHVIIWLIQEPSA